MGRFGAIRDCWICRRSFYTSLGKTVCSGCTRAESGMRRMIADEVSHAWDGLQDKDNFTQEMVYDYIMNIVWGKYGEPRRFML